VRLQTRRECEEQDRARRLLREDLRQVNADRAGMAIELVTLKQTADWLRRRALAAEAALEGDAAAMRDAHRELAEENARLRAELAAERKEKCTCD
jgi:hypothetical protein